MPSYLIQNNNWNTFFGTYFSEGVQVSANVVLEPSNTLVTDKIEGNSGTISTTSSVTTTSSITASSFIIGLHTLSSTILGYLSTIKSNVQTQIDSLTLHINIIKTLLNINYFTASDLAVMPTTASQDRAGYQVLWNTEPNYEGLYVGGKTVFLNYANNGSGGFDWYYTNWWNAPKKLMVLDHNGSLTLVGNLIVGNYVLTSTILGYLTSITSNVQAQINAINTYIDNYSRPIVASVSSLYFQDSRQSLHDEPFSGAGLRILWNVVAGLGNTTFVNCGQGGAGGFSWYCTNYNTVPHKLMTLDSGANIFDVNNINCTSITMGQNALSSTAFGYLTSVTSNVQNQINAINTSLQSAISGVFSGITNTGNLVNNSGDINVQSGYSFFVTNGTKFLRMHHNASNAYFDYTGSFNLRSANVSVPSPTNTFVIDESNNTTFSGNVTTPTISCSNLSVSTGITMGQNSLSSTTFGYLTTVTSDVQTQINDILNTYICYSVPAYSSLPTFSSSTVGYQTTLYPLVTAVNFTSGMEYNNVFSFTVPVGVWNIQMVLMLASTALGFTSTKGKVSLTTIFTTTGTGLNPTPAVSTEVILFEENLSQQYIPFDETVSKNFSFITSITSSATVKFNYSSQSYTAMNTSLLRLLGSTYINPTYIKITRIA